MKITQVSQETGIYVDPAISLWRYIKLSTLFLNLAGTIYIPVIKELKKSDPKEGLSAVPPVWVFGHLKDRAPTAHGCLVQTATCLRSMTSNISSRVWKQR
jgi:hypothetical protein